jgi:hypothetical protein
MVENNLPETFVVQSGRDGDFGCHLYYRGAIPSTSFKLGEVTGELKSIGGYVVGPGSVHPSGKPYQIVCDLPVAPLPGVLNKPAKSVIVMKPDGLVPESQRNNRLTSLAGTLRNQHLSEETIFAALRDFAVNQCEDGESYFAREEEKLRDLAYRSVTKFEAKPLSPIATTPRGYRMTAEEWRDYDFSAEEKDPLIATKVGAKEVSIIRPMTKNLILASEKSFKTTFLLRQMAGLAAGRTVFDSLSVKRAGRVVYFHAELAPSEIQERVTATITDLDTRGEFVNVRDIRANLISDEGQKFIVDELAQTRPTVVVFDPWADLIAGYDESSSKDTSIARRFIDHLIATFGVTVFIVQHTGKDEKKGGRGHSGMAGWRDTLIKLKRHGEHEVTVTVEPRWGGSELTLDLVLKDGILVRSVEVYTKNENALRTFLKNFPEGATRKEITDGFAQSHRADTVRKMIERAIAKGIVVEQDGLIFLPEFSEKGGE